MLSVLFCTASFVQISFILNYFSILLYSLICLHHLFKENPFSYGVEGLLKGWDLHMEGVGLVDNIAGLLEWPGPQTQLEVVPSTAGYDPHKQKQFFWLSYKIPLDMEVFLS